MRNFFLSSRIYKVCQANGLIKCIILVFLAQAEQNPQVIKNWEETHRK